MSEYIEISSELTGDPDVIVLHTNLALTTKGTELYRSSQEMAEGSAVAQVLAYVDGIRELEISDNMATIRRDPEVPWHQIVADVTSALKEFFL
jgi:hypothetical protein